MARRVVISGLGPVTALGLGIESNWASLCSGISAVGPITAFDASGFDCRIAAEIHDFKVRQFVPKWYRKAAKVMSREIELAVAAADLAARDAKLVTKGTASDDQTPCYGGHRMGAHIGAGLIAADLDELTSALAEARDSEGRFDIHKWGRDGLNHLTPLWLLKYLPNMLACHVSIIHDTRGPSNTITCAETSGSLSLGEAMRVIQREAADLCFSGGIDSKTNPMAFLRQLMTHRLNTTSNDAPEQAVRPFSRNAAGTVVGEGGAIVVLEALDTFQQRAKTSGAMAYCEVVGFGASQTVHRTLGDMHADAKGDGIFSATRLALQDAKVDPEQIDLIVPLGLGFEASDRAEANALGRVFGHHLKHIPIAAVRSMTGVCGAGTAAIDIAVAAAAIAKQMVPARINCDRPLGELCAANAPSGPQNMSHGLVCSSGMGGQNAAIVIKRFNGM